MTRAPDPAEVRAHWSRQEIVKTIINAMVEAKGDVRAVPAGKAADHILAYLEPALRATEAPPVAGMGVLRVACPRCLAEPGRPCLAVSRSHRARYEAAALTKPTPPASVSGEFRAEVETLVSLIQGAWDWGDQKEVEQQAEKVAAMLAAAPEAATPSAVGGVETWESINQWCDDTFGLATVPQIVKRAKEEFVELEDAAEVEDIPAAAIEAADVAICLCRVPGFADALQRKMAINRKRKWRLVGNGTGYHIPEGAALATGETSPDRGER